MVDRVVYHGGSWDVRVRGISFVVYGGVYRGIVCDRGISWGVVIFALSWDVVVHRGTFVWYIVVYGVI